MLTALLTTPPTKTLTYAIPNCADPPNKGINQSSPDLLQLCPDWLDVCVPTFPNASQDKTHVKMYTFKECVQYK